MAGPMTHGAYISDDSNTYRVRIDTSNATAGGFAAATTQPRPPLGWKMRYLWAEHSSGVRRKIYVADPASDLWKGVDTTVSLYLEGTAAAATFDVRGRIGEKRYAA